MQIKKSKKVEAAKNDEAVSARADFYRRELIKCGYTKEEVKDMGLKELRDAYNECGSDGECCSSSTKYDEAQKHIKAAIDILATNAKNDEVAKDSIANLSVVLFDIKGSTKVTASCYIGGYQEDVRKFADIVTKYGCRICKDPDDFECLAICGDKEDLEKLYNSGEGGDYFIPSFLNEIECH